MSAPPPPALRKVERSTLSDIDVFRGVAALLVVALHAREITWIGMQRFWHTHGLNIGPNELVGYLTFPVVWGSIGVPIFFVLSGYCIHRGQAANRQRTGSYELATSNFLARRFFRIYPVLIGALLLTLACDLISSLYFPHSEKLGNSGIAAFLINLASLQGLVGKTYGSNGPLWTLAIEVQFYILYPVLLLLMSRLGRVHTLIILSVANVISYFAIHVRGYQVFSSYYVTWYLGALVAEYEATGLLAARLTDARFRGIIYGTAAAVLVVGCGLFFVLSFAAFQLWAAAFAIFLIASLKEPKELNGWLAASCRWLGTFSFSLYIIHEPVIVLLHSVFFNSVKQDSLVPLAASLAVAIVAAYAFSFLFEKPALALSKKWKVKQSEVRLSPPR